MRSGSAREGRSTPPARRQSPSDPCASGLCVAYLIGVFANWGEAADRSLYANLGMIPIGLAATILASSASKKQADRGSK
jgi:hypothetical protein